MNISTDSMDNFIAECKKEKTFLIPFVGILTSIAILCLAPQSGIPIDKIANIISLLATFQAALVALSLFFSNGSMKIARLLDDAKITIRSVNWLCWNANKIIYIGVISFFILIVCYVLSLNDELKEVALFISLFFVTYNMYVLTTIWRLSMKFQLIDDQN